MQINFSFETKYGVYSDCLHLTEDEVASLSESDIEDMKQLRLNNWIAVIEAPKPEVTGPLAPDPVLEESPTYTPTV